MPAERNYWERFTMRRLSRRALVRGVSAGGAVIAAGTTFACGSSQSSSKSTTGTAPSATAANRSIAATAAANASAASPAAGAPTKHGGFTAGVTGVGQTLSPNSSALVASEYYAIFDQLARFEPVESGAPSIAPALATKWENASPTRWVFHLRPEAKFSDGQPLTSADVKFTYEYLKDPANKSALIGRVSTIASVEAVDPQTVALNTTTPDPLIPREAYFIHIYPQHYVGDPSKGDQAMGTKPIGSGAYVVDSYSQGQEIKLSKSPTSWRGTKGMDSVDLHIITNDTTRIAAFQSGEVDLVDSLPLDQIASLQQNKNSKIYIPPAPLYYGWDVEYFDPPMNDKRVRQAFAHALDYTTIAKTIYFGQPKVMQGQMLTSSTFGFNPNLKTYSYDPAMAKQLLAAAGVSNLQTKMEFRPDVPQGQSFAEACAKYLQDIGVQVQLVPLDVNVWRDGLYGRRKRGTFMYNTWSSSAALEASFALQWMLSTNPGKFYNRPDFDAAYNAATSEFDDSKRMQDYWNATNIMNDDPPGLWVVEGGSLGAYRSDKFANFQALGFPPTYFDELVPA